MKIRTLSLSLLLALNPAWAAQSDVRATTAPSTSDAASADARRELDALRTQIGELSRRMAELSVQLGDVGPRAYAFRYLNEPDRALIGVVLSAEPRGARIDAVTPDSPAERGGLRSGDIITSVNGKALASADPELALADARKQLGNLKDGEEVRLGYTRAGKAAGELKLAAQRREAHDWQRLFAAEGGPDVQIYQGDLRINGAEIEREVEKSMREARKAMDDARVEAERAGSDASSARDDARRSMVDARKAMQHAEIARIDIARHAMPWWGISLASLNPDLGRYFGSDSGVLVLSASADTLPDLKAGDIIRKVSGETVTRPEDALRALRDQPTGSSVAIDILRDRKALVLDVKVPEYKSIFAVGRAPTPPAPPAPPAAPDGPASSTAPSPPAPVTPKAPAAPPSPMATQATPIAASTSHQDTRAQLVTIKVAARGDSVGAPALWGGEIINRKTRDGQSCLIVESHALDGEGKPIRGGAFRNGEQFEACRTAPFDRDEFRTTALATFAGYVEAPDSRQPLKAIVLAVSDARAWKPMPNFFAPPGGVSGK